MLEAEYMTAKGVRPPAATKLMKMPASTPQMVPSAMQMPKPYSRVFQVSAGQYSATSPTRPSSFFLPSSESRSPDIVHERTKNEPLGLLAPDSRIQ